MYIYIYIYMYISKTPTGRATAARTISGGTWHMSFGIHGR